ncbi:hypothetical protein [Clostridium botulinum]|uniref:hypothetical protein n=1 Tax=Clostridium botulinum TaxID=1491 RepID=UPI0004D6D03D|nr:hypothetical protein [Clostridium botulinum]KEH99721.1 hypothetical protein Z952_p0045 [Clostridium botulinum C/D str. BKT75002]KEI05199.1 putative phospho-adenylylsulfate sulfotransferase [Clostridium botulinum C/D str. BKT2873]
MGGEYDSRIKRDRKINCYIKKWQGNCQASACAEYSDKVQMKTCKEMLEDNLISVSSNEYLETRINTYRDVIWDLKRMIGEC